MYLLADIGGTKTRLAASSDLQTFGEPIKIDTPANYSDGMAKIVQIAKEFARGEEVGGISLGLPGVIVPEKQSLHDSNMPEWDGRPIVDDLSGALHAKVHAINDTALVGLGEAVHGAGVGASIVVYMTISTGVNAARIVDGQLERSVYGSEIGEQYIFIDGKAMHLGDVLSGKAVEQKYGVHPRDLGKDHEAWEVLAQCAAYGLYNSIVHWSPERVVIGGSMMNEIGISVDRIRFYVEQLNRKYPKLPDIVHSSLKDEGGLYGGLELLKQRV